MLKSEPLLVNDKSLNFIGYKIFSPNKSYELLYCNEKKKFNYYAIHNAQILCKGKLKSPNDCKIWNNGKFIINDYLDRSELKGDFYIFKPDGSLILKKNLNANLHTNGISINGRYACAQTANNPKEDDGGKLFIFDINNKRVISQLVPITGWAIYYSFDEEEQLIKLHYHGNKFYRYTFEGKFSDEKKFEEDILHLKKGSFIKEYALKKINKLEQNEEADYNQYLTIINMLNVSLNKNVYSSEKAQIYKELGKIYLKFDKKNEALCNFKKALNLDPKIGVKRIYNKLLKEEI